MPQIVLATLNAKYIHAAFGLRYLHANMGELREATAIMEFDINQRPLEIVERIMAARPEIIGLGVYIWNVVQTTEVIALLKRLQPELKVVIGGPEVSYETEDQEIVRLADYVITGEADLEFGLVCRRILEGDVAIPKIIPAPLPQPVALKLPYDAYTTDDITNRVIYVEASRGCPFTCEFCLSSLDIPVRAFPLTEFLEAMNQLIQRGVKQFKFVDRTFNLHLPTSSAILQFFLDRTRPGLFVHFEMVPDRLPDQLRTLLAKFPPGAVQLEVGIQTFDETTSKNISRRQNYEKLGDNFRFLREHTGIHIHADLIVGLPGESLESFGRGFDRLVALRPQEIQVGILKRLRGTPIIRHDQEYEVVWSPMPPYEILSNRLLDFPTMQRMRRFARYWDLVGNSGNFVETVVRLWSDDRSPFESFLRFADWLHARINRTNQIALATLAEALFDFLVKETDQSPVGVLSALERDFERCGRKERPAFFERNGYKPGTPISASSKRKLPRRQTRHGGEPAQTP